MRFSPDAFRDCGDMTRVAFFLLAGALAAAPLPAQSGSQQAGMTDPVFSQIHFEQWLSGGDQSRMRWTTKVSDALLSPFQRLVARIDVAVDGDELVRRSGKGRFLVLLQIDDGNGR